MLGIVAGAALEHTAAMRVNLHSLSVAVGVVSCLLFVFGGFMLLPLALDIWEMGDAKRTQA